MRALLDLVFPASCSGCGLAGDVVCADCRSALAATPRIRMPSPCPVGLPAVHSVAAYDGCVRAMLLAYKDRDAVSLTPVLAAALRRSLDSAVGPLRRDSPLIVAVPSSRPAIRRRGYDPVARLVRAAGAHAVRGALVHVRGVRDSAGLTATQRADNLTGALATTRAAAEMLRGRDVVVVDDVVTTGATIAEATRALRAVGATVRAAAVVAATARRSGRFAQ